jgi:t-SNARE complex subunit (syntaxin)
MEAEARYVHYLVGERREMRRNRIKTNFIVIPILLIVTAFLFYVIVV